MKLLWYIRLFIQFTKVMSLRGAIGDGWNAWKFRHDMEEPDSWEFLRQSGYSPRGAWLEWLNINDQYAD